MKSAASLYGAGNLYEAAARLQLSKTNNKDELISLFNELNQNYLDSKRTLLKICSIINK